MLLGKFVQAADQRLVLLDTEGGVLLRTPRLTQRPASTPLADAQLTADVGYRVAVCSGR